MITTNRLSWQCAGTEADKYRQISVDVSLMGHVTPRDSSWHHVSHSGDKSDAIISSLQDHSSSHLFRWVDERKKWFLIRSFTLTEERISFVVNYTLVLAKSLCRDMERSPIAKWKSTFVSFLMNKLLIPQVLNCPIWFKLSYPSCNSLKSWAKSRKFYSKLLHLIEFQIRQLSQNNFVWNSART